MRRWNSAAIVLWMALALTSCQAAPMTTPTIGPTAIPSDAASSTPGPTQPQSLPTRDPLSTPDPVATAVPTPVPTQRPYMGITRADADRIGVGYTALNIYWLSQGYTDPEVFESTPFPDTYRIDEGGSVTYTYSQSFPYKNPYWVCVQSILITDASGTVKTIAPLAADPLKRWTLLHGDRSVDLTPFIGTLFVGPTGNIDQFISEFGTPDSDESVFYPDYSAQSGDFHIRTLQYDGATFAFIQYGATERPEPWGLMDAKITGTGYSTGLGLKIGMSDADAIRAYGTGEFLIKDTGDPDEIDPLRGYALYGVENGYFDGEEDWHLDIGCEDGKVVAFEFLVIIDL